MNVSDVLLKILSRHGVRHLFGIPGDAINDVTDAIRRQDEIAFIGVRHEEAGAFAASAQAKLTGQLGACMGTSGPGAIHLLNGLYDAKLDHAPVIAITGQVATGFIGTEYHQEVRLERLFADVAVYSQTVMTEEQVPAVFLEACHAALAHRGVAHISLPTNISGRTVSSSQTQNLLRAASGRIAPALAECRDAVDLINGSKKIAILAGIGCHGARDELIDFATALQAPIVRSLKAKEVIDDDHPLCIGGLGMLGGKPGVKAMDACDLLIMVGTDFPYHDFYPRDAKIIQIDIEPTRIGRRHPVDVALMGHAAATLTTLRGQISQDRSGDFLGKMQDEMKQWLQDQEKAEQSDAIPIHPPRVMQALQKRAPADSIFMCDTGTVTAWSARHLRLKPGQRYSLSGGLASMAYALPGAIGAQLAYPESRVFALAGDGAFAMLMGDFVTAVKYDLPIIILVFNNAKLGFITLEQEAKGLPEWGTDLLNPDFAAFAKACGGLGLSVEEPDQLEPTLDEALAAGQPTVIDIKVDPEALIMPPKISLSQAKNFGLAKIREALGQ
ncbi:pyruvate oxidase [Iodidimonas nitroreducens]|uniref:Pyruvate oxidase n=1 Tax=Iodidimonas nitroreducens TaxID=1236968 RepID=A0A5A7NAX1_9PROT|nr:thiamine pyrophosphate-dependent enzyme [Iodidimonas nitroreducens]GAK33093.1 putative thiamine pyrophosphate-containing protein YdaP [alpha proteobacterium Q-1]GER05521.1 pyruvate oxidase [Iodidimonas nitroreducens]